jgi:uncharacterized membrane protein (DUF485 family)
MFTDLYFKTTDPKMGFSDFVKENLRGISLSILFHTLIYVLFLNLVSFIFLNKPLTLKINVKLVISLFIIMILGYIARFYQVKDIYQRYENNLEQTRKHIDKAYITWVFLG